MKTQVDYLDATPLKRIFNSIIADYDLKRSICELIDNGIDVWVRGGKKRKVNIDITLDPIQQIIKVEDNAGGLKKSELTYIVGPGHTGTDSTDASIGIFGVGTKRAVVALAEDIKIITRFSKEDTYEVDFDDGWIKDESWSLPVYNVDPIASGTTIVHLNRLRSPITEEAIEQLKDHLQATYGKFIKEGNIIIKLNDHLLSPIFFDNWAYPPKYQPQRYVSTLDIGESKIDVEIIAGLSLVSSPSTGEYGVYFYCNDRLVVRAMKTFDVGFTKGIAGAPHAQVSLARVVVSLKGGAQFMPWNSSKSDIDIKHEIFTILRPILIQSVKHYASLSRIWVGKWPEEVFKYKSGKFQEFVVEDLPAIRKSSLPPLPKSKPRYGDVIINKNKKIGQSKPWTKGLYEGIIAADLLSKQNLEQKNRITLIILDSTLEIAFKEFLVHESGVHYTNRQLLDMFAQRHLVVDEVQKYITFTVDQKSKTRYYYDIRCKLVHERSTLAVSDSDINDYRNIVEGLLKKLYKLSFVK